LGIEGRAVRIETVSTLDVPRGGRAHLVARHAQAPSSSVRHHVYDDPAVDGTLEIADIAWLQVAGYRPPAIEWSMSHRRTLRPRPLCPADHRKERD